MSDDDDDNSTSLCCIRMLPGPLKDAMDVWTWKRCYSMQEVNSALSKVQLVGYSQKVVMTVFIFHLLLFIFIFYGWCLFLIFFLIFMFTLHIKTTQSHKVTEDPWYMVPTNLFT